VLTPEQRLAAIETSIASLAHNVDRYITEGRAESRRFNQDLGAVSAKMGTFAEDFVAPSIPRVLREALRLAEDHPLDAFGVRMRKRVGGREREVDVLAAVAGYVCVVEVKTTLQISDVRAFVAGAAELRTFFPEYDPYRVIGAVASFNLSAQVERYAERHGLLVLGLGAHLMEARNAPGFVPRVLA
jgi:hypothetical protein